MARRRVSPTRRLLRCEVIRREQLSPHVATVTLGGSEPAEFTAMGGDQWVRMFFPREGQQDLRLPTWSGTGALVQLLTMDLGSRPWVRSYSVRAVRPGVPELDVEVVVHGDESPGSRFGLRARPGQEVGILDEGITYLPENTGLGVGGRLLVADDSAVPDALSILKAAPADLRGVALLEVAEVCDVRDVAVPAGSPARDDYSAATAAYPAPPSPSPATGRKVVPPLAENPRIPRHVPAPSKPRRDKP